jgi:polyhydroxybutyrate depolymerase
MYAWGFGHGLSTGWNAGWCCNQAASQQTDDVGYVLEMVRDIEERSGCLDRSKIYGSGFSNGGFFVERLACEQPGLMAGIAPVAGCLTDYKNPNAGTSNVDSAIRTCEGDHTAAGGAPVARMSIHGNGDPAVPYVGNPVVGFVSQDDSVELWTKFNTCGSETEIVIDDGTTVCTEYINCEDGARVQQCQGPYSHSWPSFASRHMATFFDSL